MESLAEAGVRVDARADGGAAQADIVPAVKPADLPVGAPSINERLEQAASVDSTGSSGSFDYLEIINADPVSKEQLNVPLNRVTRYTSQVDATCRCPCPCNAPVLCHVVQPSRPARAAIMWQARASLVLHAFSGVVLVMLSTQLANTAPCKPGELANMLTAMSCPGTGLPGAHGRTAARKQRCARCDSAVPEAS